MKTANQAIVTSDNEEAEYIRKRMEWLYAAKKRQDFIDYSDARECDDELLCRDIEAKYPDLADLFDELGPCQYTEYQHYTILIKLWFDCLQKNLDYVAYCNSRRKGADVVDMESRHPKLRQIYEDWGDIYTEYTQPDDWIREHSHLFFPARIEVLQAGQKVPDGVVAVAVPGGIPKQAFIDGVYWVTRSLDEEVGKRPAYQIEKFHGESYAQMSQRISLAYYVHDLIEGQGVSTRDVTEWYMFDSDVFEGLGVEQLSRPSDKGELEEKIKNKRTNVDRLKAIYNLCISQSIDGVFPAKHRNTKT